MSDSPSVVLDARGLYTDPNPFGAAPAGAYLRADNTVIDRPGIIQARRGFVDTGMSALLDNVDAFEWYQNAMVFHHGSTMSSLVGSTKADYTGSFSPQTGERTRFCNSSQNLYFTASDGVYKLDAVTGTPVLAGGPKAIDFTVTQTGTTGFQAANSQVAYRVLWGYRDATNHLVYGVPSQRVIQSGFSNPKAVSVGGISRAGSTVTVTSTAHGYIVGDVVYLFSEDINFAPGNKVVATAAANSFTYTESGAAVSSTVATTVCYATRNNQLVVYVPPGVDGANFFLQVYRTAQSADVTVDPGDECWQVYEYSQPTINYAPGVSFTVTDSAPDSYRQVPLYTAPSQGGITLGKERPPKCTDISYFKGSTIYGRAQDKNRLTFQLLAVGGTAGMGNGDSFGLKWFGNGTSNNAIYSAKTSPSASTDFQLVTGGTPEENIALTANNLVRCINNTSSDMSAFYISGPDDAAGKIEIELREYWDVVCPYTVIGGERAYWAPALPNMVAVSALSRTAGTVTLTAASSGILAVGQQIYLDTDHTFLSVDFPVGWKTIASVSGSNYTYTEAGNNATAANYVFVTAGAFDHIGSPYTLRGPNYAQVLGDTRGNGLAISNNEEPEAVPLVNWLRVDRADSNILRSYPFRNSVFVFKQDGLWRMTGTDQTNFSVQQFDLTVNLLGPDTVASVGTTLFALTYKGVVPITESGVGAPISGPISKTLLDLIAAAPDAVSKYSYAVPYEDDRKYILWTISAPTDTYATQAFVYNLATGTWTRWTRGSYFAKVSPIDKRIYTSLGHTISVERKNRDYTDQADETTSLNITNISFNVLYITDPSSVSVGDVIWQSPTIWSRVTAVGTTTATLVSSAGFVVGSATRLKAISVSIRWAPNSAGSPGIHKTYGEIIPLFHSTTNLSTLSLACSTDLSSTESLITLTPPAGFTGSGPIRTLVPLEDQRGSYLIPGLDHANAYEFPSVAGYVLTTEPLSTTVNR